MCRRGSLAILLEEDSMPTWPELQQYVRSKYKLSEDSDNMFSLVWSYDDNRLQKVRVHKFTAFDQEWISLSTAVCNENELQPRVALQRNADFAIGSFALVPQGRDDKGQELPQLYIMTYKLPLKTMDPDEFELPLRGLARTADELEKTYAGRDKY
jgi:hypothetical protein